MTPASLVFTTDRLVLRPLEKDDQCALMLAAGSRSVSDTMVSIPHPLTFELAERWIDREQFALLAGTSVALTVREWQRSSILGMVTVRSIDLVHSRAELSFWLTEDARGKGYAVEACGILVRHAHTALHLNRIEAYHMVRNPASGRVLARLGFRCEGTLRARVVKHGVPEDVHVWARLRDDSTASSESPARAPGRHSSAPRMQLKR